MKRLLSLFIILCAMTAYLATPALGDDDDLIYLRRDWPVQLREAVDYIWWEIYPNHYGMASPEEYYDMDEDGQVSAGDVYDCGDQGIYTVTWVGHGLNLRDAEDPQNWMDVDGAGFPMPADPVGISYLTLWPDFGETYVAEDFNPDGSWDQILLNGTWYEIMWHEMAIRTTWEPPVPPSPAQKETWGAVKDKYR